MSLCDGFGKIWLKKQAVSEQFQNNNLKVSSNTKTFVCSKCKKKLDIKYLYRDGMCANCAPEMTSRSLCKSDKKTQGQEKKTSLQQENIVKNIENNCFEKQTRQEENGKSICLFCHKKDEYESYQVELRFDTNEEISIVDTYWWPGVRGGSNGGQGTLKLESDYFKKNSINDFVDFLTNEYKIVKEFNKDFLHLKKCEEIIELFEITKNTKTSVCSEKIKSEVIRRLRQKIIKNIKKTSSTVYELSSLLWEEAARCFPTACGLKWDGAWFKLDLQTRKLYADVGTYPDQFGATRDERYALTAAEFHGKALEFNMSSELQCMENDEDWQALFNEELNDEISKALKKQNEERKKREYELKINNAVVIPEHFADIKPTMEFDEILLELCQRYGSSSVLLTKESEKYILKYWYSATHSSVSENFQRELSSIEAAWVEQQVNDCTNNQDGTTWQSMPGGDLMSVKIRTQNKPNIELHNKHPLNKYYELQHLLQKLANYGSISETEEKSSVNPTTIKPIEVEKAPNDNRLWVDKYYMPGYDVGEIKGFTDLSEKPRCDEQGTYDVLKWNRYGNIIIITGLTIKEIETVNIPQTINSYTVAGIERMAFLHCSIESVVIPDTVKYIGGMAVGFTSKSAFSDDEERKIREQKPFAENWPTSPFMNKEFFLYSNPKTRIFCKGGTTAAYYTRKHHLPCGIEINSRDDTYFLRTISEEQHFSGGPAGHDFEAISIEMILQNGECYLEKWFAPYPGGTGKKILKGKVWIPKDMIDKSDRELEDYYNTHS